MIPVTKPYLPSRERLNQYIDGIYERNWLTNNGPLVQELTTRLEKYLGVENLLLVANGTLALQVAYKTLGIGQILDDKPSEAVTTPFTFIATTSSLRWEGIKPVFADIDPNTWCIAPENIPKTLTPQTKAIVPVHVFGNACEVESIQAIAEKYNLKVIYDAAHAFGVQYKGESILRWGDAATLSFHATKVFHTVEGGAIVFKRKEDLENAKKIINFGLNAPDKIVGPGTNAKLNEFNAAMGLCVLDELEANLAERQKIFATYLQGLSGTFETQRRNHFSTPNYSYFPLVLESEKSVLDLLRYFKEAGISARRYFYPSLNIVDRYPDEETSSPNSEELANRIICLPLYAKMSSHDVAKVIEVFNEFKHKIVGLSGKG